MENHEQQTMHLEPCHACIKFTFEMSCNFNFFIVFEFLGSIESFSGNLEILTMYSKLIFCRKDTSLNFDAVPKKLGAKTARAVTYPIKFHLVPLKSNVLHGIIYTVWSTIANL